MTTQFFKNWRVIMFLSGMGISILNFLLGVIFPHQWALTVCGSRAYKYGNFGIMPCDLYASQYISGYAAGIILTGLGLIFIFAQFIAERINKK